MSSTIAKITYYCKESSIAIKNYNRYYSKNEVGEEINCNDLI